MPLRYREVQITDDESVGDSGTKTIDLNVKDPITALIVRFKVKNDSARVPNIIPETHIAKVEIVDGGATYWTLDGYKSVGAGVYGLGRWPASWYDERKNVNQRIAIPLLFGRYLGDEEYALDPRKLLNPQLKITWTDQVLFDDDYHTIGVTARVMEDVSPPTQCLMWKEIEAWVTASAGDHKVDLPTDYPIRSLLMRVYASGATIFNHWAKFKMDCDIGKVIPFDLAYEEFTDIVKQHYGPFILRKFDNVSYNEWRQAWMGETLNLNGNDMAGTDFVNLVSAYWSFYNFKSISDTGVAGELVDVQVLVSGHFPHNCLLYPFGRQNDPATWFPAQQYGEVALKISETYASGAASVAVQQPRTLP